jgi:hypothetical protein
MVQYSPWHRNPAAPKETEMTTNHGRFDFAAVLRDIKEADEDEARERAERMERLIAMLPPARPT